MNTRPWQQPQIQDAVLLLARIGLGAILVAHGWQKLSLNGMSATTDAFASMGIPAPAAAAYFAMVVELGGGLLIMVGAFTPVVAVLVAANLAGAFWFVHRGKGVFVGEGGWELVALIALFSLTIGAMGPGRWSVDHLIASARRQRAHDPDGAVSA